MYAASAMAANTVARSAAGAAAPLFTQYMFDALGVGGGGSLIGGIACLLAPIPFIFYRYGGPIRKRSKFAPTNSDNDREKPQEASAPGPGQRGGDLEAGPSPSSSSTTMTLDLPGEHPNAKKAENEGLSGSDNVVDDKRSENLSRFEEPEKDLEKGNFEPLKGPAIQ